MTIEQELNGNGLKEHARENAERLERTLQEIDPRCGYPGTPGPVTIKAFPRVPRPKLGIKFG